MKIESEEWTIGDLLAKKGQINPKPQYQRTSVWSPVKKRLLIDSILRGYDLPKFYLRETPNDLLYQCEVTDGQQRMRAIWDFADLEAGYTCGDYIIDNINLRGKKIQDLETEHHEFYEKFMTYKLNISIIKNASQEEIRTLFARLQMGEKLNSVELRHALASNLGNVIVSTVENHPFFLDDCKIPLGRYKHQEYLDNAITASYYECSKNVKAAEIKTLYQLFSNSDLSSIQPMMQKTQSVLSWMKDINHFTKGIFRTKWGFVDTFYLLYRGYDNIQGIIASEFATNLSAFEAKRKRFNKDPELLIDDKGSIDYDKDMYDYIVAFKTGGSESRNLRIRHRVYHNHFLNSNNVTLKTLIS